MLADDSARKTEKRDSFSYSIGPLFESREGRRRLRLVNAVFLPLTRAGATPIIKDTWGRNFQATVDGVDVFFQLHAQQPYGSLSPQQADKMFAFKLKDLSGHGQSKKTWNERKEPLENQLTEVVVAILVAGENNRRDEARSAHRHMIIEREMEVRREQRRREQEAKAAIEKLEADATAFRRASDIRSLVAAARSSTASTPAVEEWCAWALRHADHIDPISSGSVFNRPDVGERGWVRSASW